MAQRGLEKLAWQSRNNQSHLVGGLNEVTLRTWMPRITRRSQPFRRYGASDRQAKYQPRFFKQIPD